MLNRQNPTKTNAWQQLTAHFETIKDTHLKDLFAANTQRFDNFNLRFEDILLDYSKNIITQETLQLLIQLAKETGVKEGIDAMFSGKAINETEKRSVLHIALRNRSNTSIEVDGKNVMPKVNAVLDKMEAFSKTPILLSSILFLLHVTG